MPNLQVKDIDEKLYSLLREKAQSENRSISQEVVTILEEYLANPRSFKPNPAQEFLKLTGAWKENRSPEEIIEDIRKSRTTNPRFESGNDIFA
ncbi:MAG: antitoxin [Spirochaetaceae bacterium]|nr:antitoxin [Spirochaetaceae bacterium]|tara:strand:- start:206 stop:484 length:279 start_codon:yes stop_codon:yes gene_type:complete